MSENFKKYVNVFEVESVLPGTGQKIKYRPITVGQMKKLLVFDKSNEALVIENILDELITESVITEGFDIKKLYLQDRFYLLVELRIATKGSMHKYITRCPNCSELVFNNINLKELPLTVLDKGEKKPVVKQNKRKGVLELVEEEKNKKIDYKSQWNYVQLNDNLGVVLDFITREKQEHILNLIDKLQLSKDQINVEYDIMGMAHMVDKVITPAGIDENLSYESRLYLIENLLPPETDKITDWLNENNFGLDFKWDSKCSKCGETTHEEISLENFFH